MRTALKRPFEGQEEIATGQEILVSGTARVYHPGVKSQFYRAAADFYRSCVNRQVSGEELEFYLCQYVLGLALTMGSGERAGVGRVVAVPGGGLRSWKTEEIRKRASECWLVECPTLTHFEG